MNVFSEWKCRGLPFMFVRSDERKTRQTLWQEGQANKENVQCQVPVVRRPMKVRHAFSAKRFEVFLCCYTNCEDSVSEGVQVLEFRNTPGFR